MRLPPLPDRHRLRAVLAEARRRLGAARQWHLPPLPARDDPRWRRWLPILTWAPHYGRQSLENDLIAALIVTLMLIPQSLAYALLAGLPAQVGLYASIAPLLIYAVFGSSRTLAVGPVAVVSLMTAAAIAPLAARGSPEYLAAAIVLAWLSGLSCRCCCTSIAAPARMWRWSARCRGLNISAMSRVTPW